MMILLQFRYIMIYIFLSFIFLKCTNWKALYIDKKNQLDICQQAKEDTVIETEWKNILANDDNINKIYNDTIYISNDDFDNIIISDLPDSNNIVPEYISSTISYENKFQISISKDSIDIYLTNYNELIGNRLIQSIKLDSLKYQKKIKIIYKNIPVEIDKTNYWKSITIGAIAGIIIIIIGFFVINKWRT